MANDNLVSTNEGQVPQNFIDIILKMNRVGNTIEEICGVLGLTYDKVKDVIFHQIHDPLLVNERIEAFRLKSDKYRCNISRKLMAHPMLAPNGKMIELWEVEKLLEYGGYKLEHYLPVSAYQQEIREFCLANLKLFEGYLQADKVHEAILKGICECLSVLNPVTDFAAYQEIFDLALKEHQNMIIQHLKDLTIPDYLLSLFDLLSKQPEYQRQFALMARVLLIQKPGFSKKADAEADIFINALTNDNLSKKTLQVAMELIENISWERIDLMLLALNKHEGNQQADAVIAELTLKQVYVKAREGKKDMALRLLEQLNAKPDMRNKVFLCLDRLNWTTEKLSFMETSFQQSLQRLVSEGQTGLVECLNFQHQLHQAKFTALKDELERKIKADLNKPKPQQVHPSDTSLSAELERVKNQLHKVRLDQSRTGSAINKVADHHTEELRVMEAKLNLKLETFQKQFAVLKSDIEQSERLKDKGSPHRQEGQIAPVVSVQDNQINDSTTTTLMPMQFIQVVEANDSALMFPSPPPEPQEEKLILLNMNSGDLLNKLKEIFSRYWLHLKSTLSEQPVSPKCELYNSTFYLKMQNEDFLASWHLVETCIKQVTGGLAEVRSKLISHPSFHNVISNFFLLTAGNESSELEEAEKRRLEGYLIAFYNMYRDASVAIYLLRMLTEDHYEDAVRVITHYLHSTGGSSTYRKQITICCKTLALHLCTLAVSYLYNDSRKVRGT